KDISNVVTDAASGVVDIFHGIDKAVADTWNNFWKDGKADGYQAGLRRDAVQPDIEAERKKRDEIEAGKSYCSRRFGGATCDDKSAQIYARFDKNDWRIQPAEFYRFHDAEVNTFGY